MKSIVAHMPPTYERYFEPFLGAGAVFFHVQPQRAVLNDRIANLMSTYRAVRDGPSAVAREAMRWTVDRETFYEVRSLRLSSRFARAGQFIYLNKTCWNGLYRVNSDGRFNVPFGRPKTPNVTSKEHLAACARSLSREVVLLAGDFEEAMNSCRRGDFVYLDPPYVTGHRDNGFVDYNEKLFSWSDQVRLAAAVEALTRRGVAFVMTNADHHSVRTLYDGFSISTLTRHSTIASDRAHRVPVTELLISSAAGNSRAE